MKTVIFDENGVFFPICDSAIGRDVMPLFLPAGDDWELACRLAFRIGRLGKGVSKKFALRYIDAVGTVVVLRPKGSFPNWLTLMDSALTTGKWLPVPDGDIRLKWTHDTQNTEISIAKEQWQEMAALAIAQVTTLATIKTGDLILPPLPCALFFPSPNHHISCHLNEIPSIHLKVK